MSNLVSPTRQTRSRQSLARIIEAAEDILREHGLPGLSIAAIGAASGISVGGIYARIKGKHELFYLLKAQALSRIEENCRARFALPARGYEDVIDQFIDALEAVFTRDERLQRALFAQAQVQRELHQKGSLVRRNNIAELVAALCRATPELSMQPFYSLAFGGDTMIALVLSRVSGDSTAETDWTLLGDHLRLVGKAYYGALLTAAKPPIRDDG